MNFWNLFQRITRSKILLPIESIYMWNAKAPSLFIWKILPISKCLKSKSISNAKFTRSKLFVPKQMVLHEAFKCVKSKPSHPWFERYNHTCDISRFWRETHAFWSNLTTSRAGNNISPPKKIVVKNFFVVIFLSTMSNYHT